MSDLYTKFKVLCVQGRIDCKSNNKYSLQHDQLVFNEGLDPNDHPPSIIGVDVNTPQSFEIG